MYNLYNADNVEIMNQLSNDDDFAYKINLVYCDMLYESMDFEWVWYAMMLVGHGSIFIIQTDWHTVSEIDVFIKSHFVVTPLNHLVWKNEWGNHPKDRFHQCYDDILIYKINDIQDKKLPHKFYLDRIQVPKATTKTKLNPSGRETKTATAWIDDICLTTTSKERVKKADGHLVKWQKPLKLFDRIILPFTDENDLILDPFAGVGSLGLWCKINNRNYIGIEIDKDIFNLAKERIEGV